MILTSNEGCGMDDQHHPQDVNFVPNNAKCQPRNSCGSERGVARSEKDGVVISQGDGAVHKLPVVSSVMEGYDTWLLSSFYGMAAFAKKYGQYTGLDKDGNPTYQLSATWQNALGNGTSAAQIIGLFINCIAAERIGYCWTMIGALFAITCFIFIQFFAVSVEMLLAGYIMSGLPW